MIPPDLQAQMLRMLDGELSRGELSALEAELIENPEARLAWQQLSRLHSALELKYRSEANLEALPVVPINRVMARQRRRNARTTALVAAAVLVLLTSFLWLNRVSSTTPLVSTYRITPNSIFRLSHADGDDTGKTLYKGSSMELDHGAAEVTLPHGVRAVIQGPSAFTLVDDRTLEMTAGRGYFEVTTNEGHGFTVVTPHQRLVDLGTRFGVIVPPDRPEVDVHVFEGKIRVETTDGRLGPTIHATRAVRLDGTDVLKELKDSIGSFAARLPDRVETLLFEDFESGLLGGQHYAVRMDRGIVRDFSGNRFSGIHNDETWTFDTLNLSPLIAGISVHSADRGANERMGPEAAINGRGLDEDTASLGGRHGTAWLEHWMGPGPRPQITIDLGRREEIESFHIWNYNEQNTHQSLTERGLKDVVISVSPDDNEAHLVELATDGTGQHDGEAGGFRFPEATGLDSYAGFQLDLSGIRDPSLLAKVRLVRIQGKNTHGARFGGLAEVQFGRAPIDKELLPPSKQNPFQVRDTGLVTPDALKSFGDPTQPIDLTAPFIESLVPLTGVHPTRPGMMLTATFNKQVQLSTGRVLIRNLDTWNEEVIYAGEQALTLDGRRLIIVPPCDLIDGDQGIADLTRWSCNSWIHLINPRGDGVRYVADELDDTGISRGSLGDMSGSLMASFTSANPGSGMWRTVAPLAEGCTYAISAGIGARDPGHGDPFLGYNIRLSSNGVVLAECGGHSPPGPPNSVTSVGFSWNSFELPAGVHAGDPLVLEIMPQSGPETKRGYLDLDNVRVSVIAP